MTSLTNQRLKDLIREVELLSSVKDKIPNAWKILELEIARTRAATLHSSDSSPTLPSSPSSQPSTSEVQLSNPQTSAISTTTITHNNPPSSVSLPPVPVSTSISLSPLPKSPQFPTVPSVHQQSSAPNLPPSSSNATTHAAAAAAIAAFADASHPPPPTAPRQPIRKRVKLPVPAEQYPDYNFVGRLLGPRGATLKRLERDTGCRIMIRGKGSIRKDKEVEVRGKPGYEHVFNEPLHVVIEVVETADDAIATQTLKRAKEFVEMLLIPVPEERDSLKRAQLRDLAILNGTHRSIPDILAPAVSAPAASPLHHPTLNVPPVRSPSPQMASSPPPPPLRRAFSNIVKPQSQLYPSPDPYTGVFDPMMTPFSRVGSASSVIGAVSSGSNLKTGPAHQRALGSYGNHSGAFNGNPSASDSFLPDMSKLRLPSLDFDGLNESGISSPLPMPLSSPTLVDPDMYPYPPTPGVLGVEQNTLNAFASPLWHSGRNGGSGGISMTGLGGGLPPRSPPPLARSPRSSSSVGALPDMSGGVNGIGYGGSSGPFYLGRQMGDNIPLGMGAFGHEFGQRDPDNGFATPLCSPRMVGDEMGGSEGLGRFGQTSPVGSPNLEETSSTVSLGSLNPVGVRNGLGFQHGHQGLQGDNGGRTLQDGFGDESSSIMLSNLFPMPGQGDGDEQVHLRLHPSRQGGHLASSNIPSAPSHWW